VTGALLHRRPGAQIDSPATGKSEGVRRLFARCTDHVVTCAHSPCMSLGHLLLLALGLTGWGARSHRTL